MSEGRIAVVNISLLLREEEDSQGNSVSLVSQLVQEAEDSGQAGPVLGSHHRQTAGHGVSEGDKRSADNRDHFSSHLSHLITCNLPQVGQLGHFQC